MSIIKSSTILTIAAGALAVLALVLPELAFAQGTDIGKIADNVKGVGDNVGQAIYVLLLVVGLLTAGVGIYKVIMAKKTNEPMGLGLAMAFGGALMLSLPLVIDAISQTAVEQGASGLDELGIKK